MMRTSIERHKGSSRPLRVLLVSHASRLGGAERVLLALATRLDRHRFDPIVLIPKAGPLHDVLTAQQIPVIVAEMPWLGQADRSDPWCWPRRMRTLDQAARAVLQGMDRPVDAVFSNGSWTLIGPALAGRLGAPHVWYFHDYGWFQTAFPDRVPRPLVRLCERMTDRFLAPSDGLAECLCGLFASDKVRQVPIGVADVTAQAATATLAPDLKAWLDRPGTCFALVGHTAPVKGWDTAIEAISQMARAGVEVRLCLIGPEWESGGQDRLREHARRAGVEDRVRFAGEISCPAAALQRSTALVIASRSEAMPLAMVEAMQVGCPVVTVPCGGPEAFVRAGGSGIVAADQTPEALADAMRAAMQPGAREAMGAAGRNQAMSFTVDRMRDQCVSMIEESLSVAPCRRRRWLAWCSATFAKAACASPRWLLSWESRLASCALQVGAHVPRSIRTDRS